jgi:hypothetical protein
MQIHTLNATLNDIYSSNRGAAAATAVNPVDPRNPKLVIFYLRLK